MNLKETCLLWNQDPTHLHIYPVWNTPHIDMYSNLRGGSQANARPQSAEAY